jgi:hypothetical protein
VSFVGERSLHRGGSAAIEDAIVQLKAPARYGRGLNQCLSAAGERFMPRNACCYLPDVKSTSFFAIKKLKKTYNATMNGTSRILHKMINMSVGTFKIRGKIPSNPSFFRARNRRSRRYESAQYLPCRTPQSIHYGCFQYTPQFEWRSLS